MDAKQVWRAALGELQVSLSPANFETWLKDTALVAVDDNRFRVAVPNGFAKDWLETRYRSLISQTLARVVGYSVNVDFEVREVRAVRAGRQRGRGRRQRGRRSRRQRRATAGPARAGSRRRPEGGSVSLNPRYTFRTFIVGSANRLAHAASLSVAERPGHAYNPLFLYGGVGLGKTHLMHAIGNAVIARFPRKRVVYVTSEKFTNEFITSIQQGRIDDFRARYRRIDLLLIDDIQFIADKERTQEEFFHTFNAIHEEGKQIVLSSDRPPQADRDPRGAAAQPLRVGPHRRPDRARPRDAHRHPARQGRGAERARRLRGAGVHRPQGRLQHPRAGGRAQPHRRLRQHAGHADQRRPRPGGAVERALQPAQACRHAGAHRQAVSEYYGVELEALKGQKRDRAIVMPRQIAMYLMRAETDVSLLRIGAELGGRDHSTVLHACDKIDREIAGERGPAARAGRRPRAHLLGLSAAPGPCRSDRLDMRGRAGQGCGRSSRMPRELAISGCGWADRRGWTGRRPGARIAWARSRPKGRAASVARTSRSDVDDRRGPAARGHDSACGRQRTVGATLTTHGSSTSELIVRVGHSSGYEAGTACS